MRTVSGVKEHKSTMKNAMVCLIALLLSACGIGPYDIEVLCEKRDGDMAIQVVRYARYSMTLLPNLGGRDVFVGIRVVNDSFFGLTTWIGETYMHEYFSFAPEVCRRSDIDGESIVIVPIYGHENLTRHVVWNRSSYHGEAENVLVLHSLNSPSWTVRGVPDLGPPLLVNSNNENLTWNSWFTDRVEVSGPKLVVIQHDFLTAAIRNYWNGTEGIYSPYDAMDYLRGNPKREGCPECEPIIWRKMESENFGESWRLTDYGLLRPEAVPEGATLISTGDFNKRM